MPYCSQGTKMQRNTKLRSISLLLCILQVTRRPCTSAWSAGRGGWEPWGTEKSLRITLVPPPFCRFCRDTENLGAKKSHIQGPFPCCGIKITRIGLLLFVLWWCHDFQMLVRAEPSVSSLGTPWNPSPGAWHWRAQVVRWRKMRRETQAWRERVT